MDGLTLTDRDIVSLAEYIAQDLVWTYGATVEKATEVERDLIHLLETHFKPLASPPPTGEIT